MAFRTNPANILANAQPCAANLKAMNLGGIAALASQLAAA